MTTLPWMFKGRDKDTQTLFTEDLGRTHRQPREDPQRTHRSPIEDPQRTHTELDG